MWATEISSAFPGIVPERGKMRLSGSVLKGLPLPSWEVWGDFPDAARVHLLKGVLLNHLCQRWLTPEAHKSTSEEQSCLYLKCSEISHLWVLGAGLEENAPETLTQGPCLSWQHISNDTSTAAWSTIHTHATFFIPMRHGWIPRCHICFWTLKRCPSSKRRKRCCELLVKMFAAQ